MLGFNSVSLFCRHQRNVMMTRITRNSTFFNSMHRLNNETIKRYSGHAPCLLWDLTATRMWAGQTFTHWPLEILVVIKDMPFSNTMQWISYLVFLINSLWLDDPMWVFANIAPGNGLLPVGAKPLPEPMMTYSTLWNKFQWKFRPFCPGINAEMPTLPNANTEHLLKIQILASKYRTAFCYPKTIQISVIEYRTQSIKVIFGKWTFFINEINVNYNW